MSMSKKDFIALADAIKEHNRFEQGPGDDSGNNVALFRKWQLETLADFCKRQNSNFMRDRWLAYIAGECGPNGGNVKPVRCSYCGVSMEKKAGPSCSRPSEHAVD